MTQILELPDREFKITVSVGPKYSYEFKIRWQMSPESGRKGGRREGKKRKRRRDEVGEREEKNQ